MSDIFISYSREDRARVKPLAEALQNSCSWSVWWDVRIPAGKTFDQVIDDALNKARCVIVVWSKTSVSSDWVKEEADEGKKRGILVPVFIDNVEFPRGFRRFQAANLLGWNGGTDAKVFQQLRTDLADVIGEPSQKKPVVNLNMSNHPKAVAANKNLEPGNKEKQEPQIIKAKAENPVLQEPEMVRIDGGKFLMGSPESEQDRFDDELQHEVFVDAFSIGRYPVTFAEYDLFCEDRGQEKPEDNEGWGRENRPVINVSWEDAYEYTQWLAKLTGQSYRLPTEVEWEYAARGGTTAAYWWGDKFEQGRINCDNDSGTATVGTFKPNPFGLYDILGNVWEWTGSLYKEDYNGSEKKCAKKEDSGLRVIRGGSWNGDPGNARSATRNWGYPSARFYAVGYRLAQD